MCQTRYVFWFVALAAAMLLSPQAALADPIYFQITGQAVNPAGSGDLTLVAADNPSLAIQFQSLGNVGAAWWYSTADLNNQYNVAMLRIPDSLAMHPPANSVGHIQDAPFTLQLGLTDKASGQSGLLTFAGSLSGTFGMMPYSGQPIDGHLPLELGFNGITTYSSSLTQSLLLGGNLYTVTLDPQLGEGGGGGGTSPSVVMAGVDVVPDGAPEPSTLILAGLGTVLAGGSWWRRKRAGRSECDFVKECHPEEEMYLD